MNTSNLESIPNPNASQNPSRSQSSSTQGGTSTPTYRDWREQRRAERWAYREARWQRHTERPYGWIIGVILILLGATFLLQNLGLPSLPNWWALFILIPAFWAYIAALGTYQDNGRLTRGGASSLTVGILLTILAFIFLLNLDTRLYWPILLLVGGLVLLGNSLWPNGKSQ